MTSCVKMLVCVLCFVYLAHCEMFTVSKGTLLANIFLETSTSNAKACSRLCVLANGCSYFNYTDTGGTDLCRDRGLTVLIPLRK